MRYLTTENVYPIGKDNIVTVDQVSHEGSVYVRYSNERGTFTSNINIHVFKTFFKPIKNTPKHISSTPTEGE